MKYFYPISILFLFISIPSLVFSQPNTKVEYINLRKFELSSDSLLVLTHEILENGKYIPFLKNMINKVHSIFIFLDARNGPSFGNVEKCILSLNKLLNKLTNGILKSDTGHSSDAESITGRFDGGFVEKQNNIYQITIADQTKTNQLLINKLN